MGCCRIDLRAFARDGMALHGRLLDCAGSELRFAADLEQNLDAAGATMERIKDTIDSWIDEQGIEVGRRRATSLSGSRPTTAVRRWTSMPTACAA